MSGSSLYIPPKEITFRLVGLLSQRVLFSCREQDPYFWHHPLGGIYPDQWWRLVPGTGQHAGQYMIQNTNNNEVIYSRADQEPYVGTIKSNGAYNDNWFVLRPGTGKRANSFQLVCPSTNMALVSRTHAKPEVCNAAPNTNYDDQFFRFFFEDMAFESIKFNIDAGRILDSAPYVLYTGSLPNDTSREQKQNTAFKKTVQTQSSFDATLGFTVQAGMEFQSGIPYIMEGKLTVSASASTSFKWGSVTSSADEFSYNFEVTVPAHSVVALSAVISRSELDVPFTMTLKSVSTGYEVKTEGKYRGVSYHDLKCHYTQPRSLLP